MNLMLAIYVCVYVIHGLARYSFVCFRSKRVDRCAFGVEHGEYLEAVDLTSYVGTIPTWLASYFLVLCDLPLPFVYFQVNNGVLLYFLDYVEDIYIMSPLCSHFNVVTSSSQPM